MTKHFDSESVFDLEVEAEDLLQERGFLSKGGLVCSTAWPTESRGVWVCRDYWLDKNYLSLDGTLDADELLALGIYLKCNPQEDKE